jgi:aminoglycoside phosphotransferase (APT) family kinase protein
MNVRTVSSLSRIARGREAEIFAWEPGIVLKLYFSADRVRAAQTELAAMNAVRDAGGPAPQGFDLIEFEGRPGLLMERIDGVDLLTRIEKQPWQVVPTGGILGRAHAALNAAEAPGIIDRLRDRLTRHLTEVGVEYPALRERGLAALARLPDGDRLCHGDFHPQNVIVAGKRTVVIDWPGAMRGDPAADVARTLMLLRLGELPEGTPAFIRRLEKVGRAFLKWRYLSAYLKASSIPRSLIDEWLLPVAISRLHEGIVEERQRLLKLIESL